VQLLAYQDHHAYADSDVARLLRAAREEADYLVVTEKDAVKLRHRWPADAPEPLVAVLTVTWETNGDLLTRALDRVPAGKPPTP
jgi:tetraacyldisaccharide-1-P 4'-kinase